MAKVYNSRSLIDPNMYSVMNQQIQNRLANQVNRDKMVGDSVRQMLTGVGKTIDETYLDWKNKKEEQERYDQIMGQSSVEQQNDPNYIAAVKDYAKTGNSQPITSYMLGKEAAAARKLEAQKREDAAETEKARNAAIRLENDRTDYLKAQKSMMDSMAAGDYTTAEIYKSQMNAIEKRYEPGTFGSSSDDLYIARKKAIDEAAAKKAIEERDERMMRESEALEKKEAEEKAANSYSNRIFLETEVIPDLKNVQDKAEAKSQIERLYNDGQLSMDDRKALHAKIDGTETVGEGKQKVHKQKAEEATGKAIDENRNKTEAKSYDGKTLVGPDWKNIPDEVKKYLKRDGNGKVTYIGG